MPDTSKAVILARGLGTRMRKPADTATLDARQAAAADAGVKAMIPIGRPFLDYVLSALADAGLAQACLVIGPEHVAVREYYEKTVAPARLAVSFAIQEEPLGTANAVQAAQAFAGADRFLVLNSDNYYPANVLRRLRALGAPGLVGFDRGALVAEGNIDAERVRKYAVLALDADGFLADIVEKPDPAAWECAGERALISMNCWSFGPSIFEAARRIARSPRGEFELTDAVKYAISRLGDRFTVLPVAAGVLDLSVRTDIASVAQRLQNVDVRL
jgi:glucose-1-phosphate thymidylyltransferase